MPMWRIALGELVHPSAGGTALYELPQLLDDHDDMPSNGPAAVRPAASAWM